MHLVYVVVAIAMFAFLLVLLQTQAPISAVDEVSVAAGDVLVSFDWVNLATGTLVSLYKETVQRMARLVERSINLGP